MTLTWPRAPEGVALDRAIGCLLGQVIGDFAGLAGGVPAGRRDRPGYPDGVRDLRDGGTWNTIAGQPTDDSELALALARTPGRARVLRRGGGGRGLRPLVRLRPVRLRHTPPRRALGAAARRRSGGKADAARAAADRASQSNGSLMRVAPIGIWAGSPEAAAAAAMANSGAEPSAPGLRDRLRRLRRGHRRRHRGRRPGGMRQAARAVATAAGSDGEAVVATLDKAAGGVPPADFQHQMGWVLTALGNAFFHLAATRGPGRGAGPDGRRRRRHRHQRRHRRRAAGGRRGPQRLAGTLVHAGADLPSRRRIGGSAPAPGRVLARRPHRPRRGLALPARHQETA